MKTTYLANAIAVIALVEARNCRNLRIPITASARNGVFDYQAPKTEIDIINFALDLTRHGTNFTQELLTGYTTVSGRYEIAATYCEPDSGPSGTLQILTHGIGADRSYWDLPFNNYNYSYVSEAVDRYGLSTFAYDRLGIGESSHGDPVDEIQAFLEIDALKELTLMLKAGKIKGIPKAFSKIAHTGHSYGSQQTYALTAMLTTNSGFSENGTYQSQFQLGSNFIQANTVPALADYPDGYLAAGAIQGAQTEFLAPGQFDPAILAWYFARRQPVTVGESLSAGLNIGVLNYFPGPVHIVTGNHDITFCGGNCLDAPTGYSSIPTAAAPSFTKASVFDVDIIPNAGHGLNFEYEHPMTYRIMLEWLVKHGCGADAGK